MAHVEKYMVSASGHMFNHYGRSEDMERSAYVIRGNEKIDPARTPLNYNLAPVREGGQMAFLKQRLSEVRVLKRSDVNVFCDWVVTLPKFESMNKNIHATPNQEHIEKVFFERTYRFLADRYGEQNVISAYVHKDETTPHMHFAFVPVTVDKKRGDEKVSAKEVLTKRQLQTFHGDLERHLDGFRDWHFDILNGATREGNKAITELKRGTAIEELAQQQAAATARSQEIHQQMEREEVAAQKRSEELQKAVEALEAKKNRIYTSIETERLQGKRTLTGALKGVSYEEYLTLKRTAAKVDEMTEKRDQALRERDRANESAERAYTNANSQLAALRSQDEQKLQAAKDEIRKELSDKNWEIDHLRRENQILEGKVKRLEQAVDYLKNTIREKLPELVMTVESRVKQLMSKESGRGR